MASTFPLIVEAAKRIASAYVERRQNAESMASFAQLLSQNNLALLREMSRIVRQSLSDMKLNDCTNKLATLATFYSEYARNLDDQLKLSVVEQQCQFVLDTLSDAGIHLAGVRTYVGVASLRINALALKAAFEPGDRENAKNLARAAVEYAQSIRPMLIEAAQARVGPVIISHSYNPFMGRSSTGGACTGVARFLIDGNLAYENATSAGTCPSADECKKRVIPQLKPIADNARKVRINELISQLPLSEIDQCIEAWKAFVANT